MKYQGENDYNLGNSLNFEKYLLRVASIQNDTNKAQFKNLKKWMYDPVMPPAAGLSRACPIEGVVVKGEAWKI